MLLTLLKKNRRTPKPYYEDFDLMDPQKPDYGSIAINEIIEADEREYL